MLTSRNFYLGIAAGLGGLYAYHKWVRPIPSTKA
jgi:hypothetical protein